MDNRMIPKFQSNKMIGKMKIIV